MAVIQLTEEMTRAGVGLALLAIIERDYFVRPKPKLASSTDLCRGCGQARFMHGGNKQLGVCPSEVGNSGGRFKRG